MSKIIITIDNGSDEEFKHIYINSEALTKLDEKLFGITFRDELIHIIKQEIELILLEEIEK